MKLPEGLNQNQLSFVDFVRIQSKKHKIYLGLRNSTFVKTPVTYMKCAGYFDEKKRVLMVATKSDYWFRIFLHEYAHMTQWLENIPLWARYAETRADEKMDAWLNGGDVENHEMYIDIIRDLELDNEKRTVDIINEWKFNDIIDVNQYIKESNAYVLSYNRLKATRIWEPSGGVSYSNEAVLNLMSDKFDMDYTTLSPELIQLFDQENL